MKKKLLFGAVAALFLSAGIFTTATLTEKNQVSDLTLNNIEAMTQSSEGCVNRPGENNGYCVRGGGLFFCAEGGNDCVQGKY